MQEIHKKLQKGLRVNKRWLIRTKQRWNITDHIDIPDTVEDAKQKTNKAHAEYRNAQRKSPELRSQFLDYLIQESIDNGNDRKMRELRSIKEREQTRDVHTRIKLARGVLRGGGVRFVHKTDEHGNTRTVQDKLEMEQEIMKANEAKLHSADESPIRQGALAELLSDHDYERWERFIAGEIELPEGLEDGTKLWLEKFKGMEIEEQEINLSTEDYVRGWNKVKEHTSCAPGALHFGTFKASRWCDEAARLHTILAKIPIKTGYIPEKWTTSVDSMLPKKEGEWRASKLRLTSLLRPDFNHNNKILGRTAMARAEASNKLAPEQYGSRKRLSAKKHALNKRLMVDVLRLQKRPGIICANDAKACYDRILHFAAYISIRRVGIPKEAAISMLEPIRKLKHFIRTAYGDSEFYYGGEEWTRDPSGICQGNGAGPAIWALVSSPLLDMIREAGYGAKLHSAIGDTFINMAGFAFVDDADTIQAGDKGETTESLLIKAQAQLDLWESGIRATGGGISGDKTDFSVINYKWQAGKWKYEKKLPETIMTVNNPGGPRERLKQLEVNKARRTLGVWQALDGNERKETQKLKKKAQTWSRAIARSTLGRVDTTIGIKTSLYPSVTFGLAATTMSKKQCADIFKPIRAGVLSKAGYVKTIPEVVVHAPEKYGGIGLMDFYTYQHIQHIKVLVDEGGGNSPTSKLLDILVHGHTLEAGRKGKLLHQDYKRIGPIMTETWMKKTAEFIHSNGIRIEYEQQVLKTWRQNDSLIMDDVMEMQGDSLSEDELQAVNRCRMYLRATTKSDISNGDGTAILESARDCLRDWTTISSKVYDWPYQPRPGRRDKETWQRVLYKAYGTDSHCRLWNTPLGTWDARSRQHARWMYDPASTSLYERRGAQWIRWAAIIRRTRTRQYEEAEEAGGAMHSRWRIAQVTTSTRGRTVVYEGSDRQTQEEDELTDDEETEETSVSTGIKEAIDEMEESIKWVIEEVTIPEDNGLHIANQISQGTAKYISDGSTKDDLGTAAAVYLAKEEFSYFVRNRTPGSDDDQSSYRSELCGILANVLMLKTIVRIHGIKEGKVTIACDNESALWMSFGATQATTGDACFDLIRVIHHAISNSTIDWEPKHVRGHQDRQGKKQLDNWAKANIFADEEAGDYWEIQYGDGTRQRPNPGSMPGEGWRIRLKGRPVTNKMEKAIYEHVYYKPCMEYWTKKGRIMPNKDEMVDWKAYDGATKLLPYGKRQWARKHFCGFEGTNQMLFRQGRRPTEYCPKCEQVETYRHIARCQSNDATQAYRSIQQEFERWLSGTTSPGIKEAVLEHLRAYRETEDIREGENWSEELKTVSRAQEDIGPNAFMEGCITSKWKEIQRMHLQAMDSRKNPRRWARELIKKVMMVSWDMWDTRNGWVHRETLIRKQQISAQLDETIGRLHSKGRQNTSFYPDADKLIFQVEEDKLLEKSDYQKRTWISAAKKTIARDDQTVARDMEIRIMREYLRPGSTDNMEKRQGRIIGQWETNFRTPEGTRRGPINQEE